MTRVPPKEENFSIDAIREMISEHFTYLIKQKKANMSGFQMRKEDVGEDGYETQPQDDEDYNQEMFKI